jgi:hypothetical protein
MTYGEATDFVTEFLRGDNSNATVSPIHFEMAIMEIATMCTPSTLKVEFDGTQTDVFRMLHEEEVEVSEYETKAVTFYIKNPVIPTPIVPTDEMEIDQQLSLAVIFQICSYLSNKYTDRFEAKVKRTISVYVSNEL